MEVTIAPTTTDLLRIIALLSEENDSLRDRIGNMRCRFTKRTFTREELDRAGRLIPVATATGGGSIIIQLES